MSATTPFASTLPTTGPIRAAALRHALIAGARRVIARRDALNKINVFPVPDGDTGNNLALTLSTVLTGALQRRAGGVGRLLRRVGEHNAQDLASLAALLLHHLGDADAPRG